MAPPATCPFRICLENGEILCFDPWFVRSVSRGPHFVRDFCQGDFTACPFYQMQKIKRVHA